MLMAKANAKAKAKAKAKAWPFPALSRHMSAASQTLEKGQRKRADTTVPALIIFRKPECQEAMALGRGWPSSSVSRPLVRSSEVKRPPRWLSSSNVPFSMIRP